MIPDAGQVSRRVKTGTALIALSLLGLMNWYHPTIRFSSSDANRIAPLALNLLPWVGGVLIAPQLRRWRLVGYVTLMFPLLFFSGCFALFSLINLPETAEAEETNPNFRPIERFVLTHSTLMLYRTDCGAVCRPGLVFRQERRFAPGLLLVREIGAWPDASKAWIYHAAPNEWCVQIDGSVSSPGRHFTLHLDDHW